MYLSFSSRFLNSGTLVFWTGSDSQSLRAGNWNAGRARRAGAVGGGDKDKDKDEGSFSGRGLVRRGDSFRGAGQEGKVVVEYVEHRTKSEVGELSSHIDIDIDMSSRGRGKTVQRWPTVGFFTRLRPIGAHTIRQSGRGW